MQKCSIKIECQEISQSPTTMHKQCQRKVAKNCHPENNWGQININLVNQKGQRLMGAQ
jgi:flagella basal body P-ring formation protein FlgA